MVSLFCTLRFCFLMIRRPPRSTLDRSSAASDVYKRQPFAGVLALALSNIPNLGKLFSESIEEIDNGPVEAVTSTGATRMQSLVYAIFPQLVPPFLAFIIYQWDINIRMSTVIGFVGGGGIGQQFRIWVSLNQYGAAGTAILAIVIMVWTMDYLSAKARERLI